MRRRRTRYWLGVVALFTVATVGFTWPLVQAPASTYLLGKNPRQQERRDPQLTSWILGWVNQSLRTDPRGLFDANVFHPVPNALAFSEHIVGGALQVLPVDLLFADPVLDHNALALLSFVAAGVGMTALLRELGTTTMAALAGGMLFAFAPWRLVYLMHVHMLAVHCMPWTLFFAHRTLRRARWSDALACAGCFWLQAATSVYHAYFFGLTVAIVVLAHRGLGVPAARRGSPRLLAALVAALVALVPLFLPYLDVRDRFGIERPEAQVLFFSGRGIHYLESLLMPLAHLRARFGDAGPAAAGFVGAGTWLLAALAWWRGRRRLTLLYLIAAVTLGLVSLGPRMSLHLGSPAVPGPFAALAAWIPGWSALRAPVRASIPALLALTVLAAFGADALVRRARSRGARVLMATALGVLVVAECWRPPLRLVPAPRRTDAPGLYGWLRAHAPGAPLLELPFGSMETRSEYMVQSLRHRGRLVTGYSGWDPTQPWVRWVAMRFPAPEAVAALADLGVRHVLVHAAAGTALCREDVSPLLRLAQHDADGCILETVRIPARDQPAPGRLLPHTALRASGPDGRPLPAVVDGDLGTHWRASVTDTDRVRLDLDAVVRPIRLVLRLGPHFGEYPTALRVETSVDGAQWRTVRETGLVPAPLAQLRAHADDLSVSLALAPGPARIVRLVVPAPDEAPRLPIPRRGEWGAHEIELHVE